MTAAPEPGADVALMSRVQADEPGAFDELYDRFGTDAYRVAYGMTRNGARAEDVVQEAFLSVWRHREGYRSDAGSVRGWLMGTVRHRAIDALRLHGRHDTARSDEEGADERVQAPGDVADAVCERDEACRLRTALAGLPEAQRDVITLAYFGQCSATEIADELSLPLGTVKGRMRLGLAKLRGGTARG